LKLFSALAAALAAKSQTSKQLLEAVEIAAQADQEAKTTLAALQARRVEFLAGDDAARARYRRDLAQAEDDAEDAAIYLAELQARLEQAKVDEANVERRSKYDAALAARAKAAKRLEAEYTKHATALRDLILIVAEADALVTAANRDLPDDMPSISEVEVFVRDRPSLGVEEISRRRVSRWVDAQRGTLMGDGSDLPPPMLNEGIVTVETGGGSIKVPVEKRPFFEVKSLAPQYSLPAARLAALSLPALRAGAKDIWTPYNGSGGAVLNVMKDLAARPDPTWEREEIVQYLPITPDGGEESGNGDR